MTGRSLASALLLAAATAAARADVSPGVIADFESGTTESWRVSFGTQPTAEADGGPLGAGDGFLSVASNTNLAVFNTDLSGVLDSAVTAIEVDLFRDSGQTDLEMRLVLFGPGTGNRWTSSTPAFVEGNGQWATYSFSVLESDLTQVQGAAPYASLVSTLNRVMFRHDPGTPSQGGASAAGTVGIDNIIALGNAGLPGDFSNDGVVDAIDYATWREDLGGEFVAADLDTWRNNYGASVAAAVAAPEPATALMIASGVAGVAVSRRRLNR